MTNASRQDDASETTDEEYLAKYRDVHGRLNLGERANPFHNGHRPMSRAAALYLVREAVYAVQYPDGIIKIGWTQNLRARMRVHDKRGAKLLAIRIAERDHEQTVHDVLAAHVHHGREWYWPHQPVLDLINSWRTDLGLDPIQP